MPGLTHSDVTVLISGTERTDIATALSRAEHAMENGGADQEHDALRDLVDLLGDLQCGSETSDFLFPIPD